METNLARSAEASPIAPPSLDSVPTERWVAPASRAASFASFDPYALEGQRHVREREKEQHVDADYMQMQTDMSAQMRTILVDWLVDVVQEYTLSDEALHLAVHYFDTFLSLVPVQRSKLQLVGVTCMFLAAKFEEQRPPSINEFVYITDTAYDRIELLQMEGLILSTLRFNLSRITAACFLKRFRALMDSRSMAQVDLARYLLELTLQDLACLNFLPSVLAASAICLAAVLLQYNTAEEEGVLDDAVDACMAPHLTRMYNSFLDEALEDVQLTGYTSADLLPCIKHLVELAQEAPTAATTASYVKFCNSDWIWPVVMKPPDALVDFLKCRTARMHATAECAASRPQSRHSVAA
jgi:cyclin A